MQKVSIIIPVILPDSARRCIDAIKRNAGIDQGQYEIVTAHDEHGAGCPEMVRRLTNQTSYDLVMFLGDDTEPEPGFLSAALASMAALPDGWGVVGLNTEGGNDHAHWLAHKKMLEHIPGGNFFCTEYHHGYCDDELKDIAIELRRWTVSRGARTKHYHPVNRSAEFDDGYKKAYGKKNIDHDKRTYQRRKVERIREREGMRFGIGFPLTDLMVHSQFMVSFLQQDIPDYRLIVPQYPGKIDAVRNNLVDQALMAGCTHLLLTDTDQIFFDKNTVYKLLSHDKPVVAARVHRRYPPFDPLMLRGKIGELQSLSYDEIEAAIENEDLVEVDATGCGCVLYDTRVFLTIEPPWFEMPTNPKTGMQIGEDIYFCKKIKDAGFPIFVDAGIEVGHMSTQVVGMGTFRLFKSLTNEVIKNG